MEDLGPVIIHAARLGNVPVMQELLDRNVNVDHQDAKGYTPLIIACYNNQYEAAKFLLENGANVNAQDFGGNTALMGASFKGTKNIAELLLDHGADIDMQHGNGGTALMFAAMFGRRTNWCGCCWNVVRTRKYSTCAGLSVVDLAVQQGK